MKEGNFLLVEKEDLYNAGRMWRLRFEAPGIEAEPGQFVNIEVEGQYLRRPISVAEYTDGFLDLIIRPVGEGTLKIVSTPVGRRLNMLTGLGNSFSTEVPASGDLVLLLGGGVGYAPLVGLMKKLRKEARLNFLAVFGFNTEADVPLSHINELRDEGFPVEYSTMTGEMGNCGNAVEVAQELVEDLGVAPSYFFTCGPMVMMNAVCRGFDFDGQLSLEARMGCGFGACMGCSIHTPQGARRICKDGPVFAKSNLILGEKGIEL